MLKELLFCFKTFGFIIFINQMFGSSQKSVEQKPLKDANFLSIYVYVYKCMFVWICLHANRGRCAKTEPSSYGSCETKINDAAVVYWPLNV